MEAPGLASLLSEPLLNRPALAAKLRVSEDTVQKWTVRRRIPHFRWGHRTVRYNYAAVIASLGTHYQVPKVPFKRRHSRRKTVKPVVIYQPELPLEYEQLALPFEEFSEVADKIT